MGSNADGFPTEITDTGTEGGTVEGCRSRCDKYNLRKNSLRVRIQVEKKTQEPKVGTKVKPKPPPLSKYRRRSANARERCRMKEMNEAFEELKKSLPQGGLDPPDSGSEGGKGGAKPTKVTVLRLAINYIAALTDMLGYDHSTPRTRSDLDSSSDDLGSDAASASTPSRTSGSGDDESLMSSDMDMAMSDLNLLTPDLCVDFPSELAAEMGADLMSEDDMCFDMVASVL